jgi:uncharacterized protein
MVAPRFTNQDAEIVAFCRRWMVRELALFGSVLRDDFRPDSDVDVLVDFQPDAPWSYWEWPQMTDELESIFGRRVDLIDAAGLKNPFRRKAIFETRRVMYAA